LQERIAGCTRCGLSAARNSIVFGAGSITPRLALVGEAPGAEEDRQGLPFVGRAGQLLDRMLIAAGLTRQDVYICNTVCCRPPDNRKPEAPEMAACEEFFKGQLEAIRPPVIVALGATATQNLLKSKKPIGELRGQFGLWRGIPVLPTYHPAFLLRPQGHAFKKQAWEDLLAALQKTTDPKCFSS
jgi:DNA polymerase